jgi:hypothetical protein
VSDEGENPDYSSTGPKDAAIRADALAWYRKREDLAALMALVAFSLYVSPIVAVTVATVTTSFFQEQSQLFAWFVAFAEHADTTLNQFHKVLLPMVSAVSVAAFRSRPDWRFALLASLIFIFFALATFMGVLFDMESTRNAIALLRSTINIQAIQTTFTRFQETLLIYLMTLIGIGVSNAK